ncbi:glycosyltransferase family 2 protein [Flavobacterium psychrotolerans]|uniref:Glycosyl transferase n=1 Tax=Flavobacterium psychrotolerans TaxID=2169410 RepID=A0A2U1JQG9_9FLAO|nr:glycosyltransferase family A protein [Flavobacterium psychrotolerans]PWA07199.1 glycosyl transferase [Flavobacterium psychrotolerans]
MLSILIPTYNYNVFELVSTLHKQVEATGIIFEIICLDDASNLFFLENEKINGLEHSSYEILETNIGRSKIRNLLAKKAKYDWLLFLDSDVFPKKESFISEYIQQINTEEKIVNGGLLYQTEKPEKSKLLRWVYGKKREALPYNTREHNPYLCFLTLNFLIPKAVFEKVSFNETIPNLRHEDTLFSYNLMQKKIKIVHIDNPIYHYGLDDFENAIKKENDSLLALKHLIDNRLLPTDYIRISKIFSKIKDLKLIPIFSFFHKTTRIPFLKNLSSTNPSLFLFDLYRLGYLCTLENKSNVSNN